MREREKTRMNGAVGDSNQRPCKMPVALQVVGLNPCTPLKDLKAMDDVVWFTF